MSDTEAAELEKTIAKVEEAIAILSEARTDAVIVAAQGIHTLEWDSVAVQSATMLHKMVQIAQASLAAEEAKRVPTFGLV